MADEAGLLQIQGDRRQGASAALGLSTAKLLGQFDHSASVTTVWIYVDTRYYPGHPDHIKVFANPVAADEWFKENDPEGAAFEYEVLE